MPDRHRSARRRSRSPLARFAVPVGVPLALVLAVGAIVAVVDHSGSNSIADAANANCASDAAYVVSAKPAGTASSTAAAAGTAAPTTAASSTTAPTAAASTTAASSTAAPTVAVTGTAPGTGAASGTATPTATASGTATAATATASPATTGAATGTATATSSATATATPCASASATSTAATTTTVNVNCDIIVPANPLSAQGLATPYQLTGPNGMSAGQSGCTMANAGNLGAFVQATILNTQTGQLYVYNPLVITQGTTAAAAPVVPQLPQHYVATVEFGFNGTDLTQVGATGNALRQGNCVNGQGGTVFGQVSFCNGINFFNEAFRLERAGKLKVPSEGTSAKIVASGGRLGTGQDCPTVRNFDMIDQDQSDNVTAQYLLNPATGQTAQDTTSNTANMAGATLLTNGSDNALLDLFMDPTFGCTPFMAPDLGNNNQPGTSQALDELLAAKNQPAIPALVPENDEMVLNGNGNFDAAKTNLYRAEVGQATINWQNNRSDSPAMYCQNTVNIQTAFLAANQTVLATGNTPVPAVGNNLFTFLANRLNMTFANLKCQNFGLTNPVSVTLDGNGAAVAATLNTTTQRASTASGSGPTSTWRKPGHGYKGRTHHQWMDPSGM